MPWSSPPSRVSDWEIKKGSREIVVFFVHGKRPRWNIPTAGCVPAAGTERGHTLTIYWQHGRSTYKFSGDEAYKDEV